MNEMVKDIDNTIQLEDVQMQDFGSVGEIPVTKTHKINPPNKEARDKCKLEKI